MASVRVSKKFAIGNDRLMDSTGALELRDIPDKLLVVGGGYIGLEMGTVYAELGSQVTVVEMLDGLLPGADRDLVKPLHKRLEKLPRRRCQRSTGARTGARRSSSRPR